MILEETGELFSQLSEAGYEPRICTTHGDNPVTRAPRCLGASFPPSLSREGSRMQGGRKENSEGKSWSSRGKVVSLRCKSKKVRLWKQLLRGHQDG